MLKKHFVLLSVLAITPVSAVAAIESVSSKDIEKTVVITATRTSETIDETLAPVTVFTHEDIEKSQAKTLAELLEKAPGVQVIQDGSQGSNTGFFIRGTNSDHALVLIDGLRTSSATLGTTDIQYLDLDQVERIEIVRGSRSSLYGADAIGGVVQIFTKKSDTDKTFSPVIKTGFGNDGAKEGSLSASGLINNTRYNITNAYYGTNGFDSTNSIQPIDSGSDPYWNRSNSINISHDFDSGAMANVIFAHNEGRSDYDSIFTNLGSAPYIDFETQNISTYFKLPVNKKWSTSLQYGNVRNETSNYYFDFNAFGMINTPINTDRDMVNWQNDISITDNHLLSLGVDYYIDKVNSTNSYTHNTNENTGYFAQDQFSFGKHDFILSARHDVDNAYGDNDTGNISWGTDINQKLRATASASTSFKAPTINALYWPLDIQGPFPSGGFPCSADDSTIYDYCTYVTEGTPGLQPEEAKSFEVGLSGDHDIFNWSANVFQTEISNLINWDSSEVVTGIPPNETKTITYAPSNINDAKIQGIETVLGTQLIGWQWAATATFLNPRDENTGDILPRRAKRTFNLDADRKFGKFDVGASWFVQSSRYNDTANTAELGGYGILNTRATYHLTKEVDVQLKVNNVFDKDYALSQQSGIDFEQDGVNGFLTVIYKPDL